MEEEKRNYAPIVLVLLFVALVVVVGGFLNYKTETLVCSKTEDICKVERVDLFNIPSTKKIVKYSDIEGVSYYRQRIKGNRYGKGYREYILVFDTKNGDQVKIFSKTYYEKEELSKAISDLRTIMQKNEEEFSYNRD